jgi:hypothetical protein
MKREQGRDAYARGGDAGRRRAAEGEGHLASLVKERLADKPISDALKAAFVNASAQRGGARGMIQAVLLSEGSALSLDDFLRKRIKRKAATATTAAKAVTTGTGDPQAT